MKTREEQIRNFKKLFNRAFDENGDVKACGRDNCKALIEISDILEPSKKHGDLKTGNMYINSIKELSNLL